MKTQPEALRLAAIFDGYLPAYNYEQVATDAAAELRRLHAENERLSATVKAREDEILTHSEAFYEATRLLSEEREKNERLAAALASSCDEQRHELWESGGVAGCERARVAERQRDALLEALKSTGLFLHHCWCDVQMNDYSFEKLDQQMQIVDAAIKAAEETK